MRRVSSREVGLRGYAGGSSLDWVSCFFGIEGFEGCGFFRGVALYFLFRWFIKWSGGRCGGFFLVSLELLGGVF